MTLQKNPPVCAHKSRKGKTYFIHEGKTKKGNPRYCLSPKNCGNIVEKLPKGYEIYDHPVTNQCFIRPIPPKIIFDSERALVEKLLITCSDVKYYRIALWKNTLVIYTPGNQKPLSEVFRNLFGDALKPHHLSPALLKNDERFLHFAPVLRFILEKPKKRKSSSDTKTSSRERIFSAERWDFGDEMNTWISLLHSGPLKELCQTFFPHLDKDSFYELPFF